MSSDQQQDIFVNGRFVSREEARLSAFDAGIQHGVGLFETMRAELIDGEPHVHQLTAHMDRLELSAMELSLTQTLNLEALAEAVERTVVQSGHERARVRLTITGGDLNLLRAAKGEGKRSFDPTLLIDAQPATAYPAEMYERGAAVTVANTRVNPLEPMASHKTLSYWWRLRELQVAAGRGGAESLVFQVSNHAAGGCVSNLLLVKDGVVRTPIARGEEEVVARQGASGDGNGGPPLPSPVLPGIVRACALEEATKAGLVVERRMLSMDDILSADELMLTNSSWGVLPVVNVEGRSIGSGSPGPVANSLLDAVMAQRGMTTLRH